MHHKSEERTMVSTEETKLFHENQPTDRRLIHQLRGWSYEVLAVLVSVSSFAGLVIALREFDGKPQEDWRYKHVTRNTIVAAIATIARTSLLAAVTISISQNKWTWFSQRAGKARQLKDLKTFDDASRGAIGSLRLLVITNFQQIASFGALVVVLALAFDTFAQNVLGYEFREDPHSTRVVGGVPRSEVYGPTYSVSIPNWFAFDVPFQMKAAISNGVMGLSTSLPAPLCSTGNCTWPIIPSLAMCGQCVDITTDLHKNCSDTAYWCTYSLPDGTTLQGPKPGTSTEELAHVDLSLFNISATTADVYNQQHLSAAQKGKIHAGHFSTIQTELKEMNPGDGLVATQCDLWFCVQTYKVSIQNGIEEVFTKSEWSTATPYELNFTLSPGNADMISVRNFTDISDPAIDSDAVYSVSYANAQAISLAFKNLVSGSVAWNGHWAAYRYTSDGTQSIWQSRHNLSSWIDTVASGITTVIRDNATVADPEGSGLKYAGHATMTKSFVKVRWAWILYPSAMLIIGILHFLATIWQTTLCKTYAWKANPIVPLLLRLDMANDEVGRMDDGGRIPKEILDQKALLLCDEGRGWTLSTDYH